MRNHTGDGRVLLSRVVNDYVNTLFMPKSLRNLTFQENCSACPYEAQIEFVLTKKESKILWKCSFEVIVSSKEEEA